MQPAKIKKSIYETPELYLQNSGRYIYDSNVTEGVIIKDDNTRTRGHDKKLKKRYCGLDIQKYSFTNRIVDIWNSLPAEIVNAKTVFQFEISLDKFWKHQEVKCNFRAELSTYAKRGSDITSRQKMS